MDTRNFLKIKPRNVCEYMTYAHIFSLNTRLAILPGKCTRVFPTDGSEMIATTNRVRIVMKKIVIEKRSSCNKNTS